MTTRSTPADIPAAKAGQVHLRLLETTDLHMHLRPYDYYADAPGGPLGLSGLAPLIADARAGAPNVLLFDNGDALQGTPMGDYAALERDSATPHPMIAAFNALGYDAATLGNHEFNYGLAFLDRTVKGANFPVVLANLVNAGSTPDTPLFPPYTLLRRKVLDGVGACHDLTIGVIGLTPPQVTLWDREALAGTAETCDIVETAQRYVPQMRAEGADVVVALCHSGIGAATHVPMMENAALPLGAVAGIDAILCGHSHMLFPSPDFDQHPGVDSAQGTLNGTPAVMAGFWGSHLGVIDLLLEQNAAGQWQVRSHKSAAWPATAEGDTQIAETTQSDHEDALAYIRRPVCEIARPLTSYFSLVTLDPSVEVVAQAQRWHVTRLLRGTALEDLPVLSAVAPLKAGGRGGPGNYTDVPAGPIAIRNVADLYRFPNTIRAIRLTGAEITDWLERSASLFNQIPPGAVDAPLHDPTYPSYFFDSFLGLTYEIDLSQPARYTPDGDLLAPEAQRIVNARLNGHPLNPQAEIILATNNYRASGGGGFPGTGSDRVVIDVPDLTRDVLVRYLAAHDNPVPAQTEGWRFVPMPGTTVTFETSPKALSLLDQLPGLALEDTGKTVKGFALVRLRL